MVAVSDVFYLPKHDEEFFNKLNSNPEKKKDLFPLCNALDHAGLGYICESKQITCSIFTTQSIGCIVIELIDIFQTVYDKLKQSIDERVNSGDKFIGIFTDLCPERMYICFKI